MSTLRSIGRSFVRGRYALFVLAAGLLAWAGWVSSSHSPNDWVLFEVGARTLVHYHHLPIYGSPLHVYSDNPELQIGPPAILAVAAVSQLPILAVNVGFVVVMAAMVIPTLLAVEGAARALTRDPARVAVGSLLGGLPLAALWGYEMGQYHHLDDAMALLGLAVVSWVGLTRRPTWILVLVLGTTVAVKPWAIVCAPVLLGLPRRERALGVLGFIVVAAGWWAPFVLGAPDTIHKLGTLSIIPTTGTVPYLLGFTHHVEGWLRPVQFFAGTAAAAWAARRSPWLAAPVAGMAVRVLFDPDVWAYYGLGPVLVVLVWELGRGRRIPGLTAWTLVAMYGVRLLGVPTLEAAGKLAWVVSVLLAVRMYVRRLPPRLDEADAVEPVSGIATDRPVINAKVPSAVAG